jgi:hypothetical protein
MATPPAHLPPLVAECEMGENYSACGMWIWRGSSYSARWWNGATGQMTVTSDDPANLRVQRTDTSGALTGLTATYTGRWTTSMANDAAMLRVTVAGQWTGSVVDDAKMSFHMKGTSGEASWMAVPAVTPIFRNPDPNAKNYVNFYTAQLTGYAVNVNGSTWRTQARSSTQLGTLINDYRLRGERPLNPGESRDFAQTVLDIAPNYMKGANYPDTAAIAAVYSDGTTFGDANVLKVMMEHRREMIEALTSIGTAVCQMGMRQVSMREIGEALDKQHAEEDAQYPAGKYGRNEAYYVVGKRMGPGQVGRMTPGQAAKHVWGFVNQVRSGLAADPVKDGTGQLMIPAVTPLECSMP